MQFVPKSEKEIAESGMWEPGVYGFEVIDEVTFGTKTIVTSDSQSEKGNDMIVLVLKVYNDEGQFKIIVDYLLESIAYKLRHAADACGILDKYESGSLCADDFKGKSGNLKLRVGKPTTKKDEDGKVIKEYAAKNEVGDYVTEKNGEKTELPNKAATKKGDDPLADYIPF